MSDVIWLATVFGPLLFITGLWMLMFTGNVIKIVASVKDSLAALWLMGFLNLLFGLGIVSLYNRWTFSSLVFVTILGWVYIIRGLAALFVPKLIMFSKIKNPRVVKMIGLIPLIWGVILCYVAFFR